MQHVRNVHQDYTSVNRPHVQSQCQNFVPNDKTQNIYSWLDWVVCKGLPFTFVDDKKTQTYTNLKLICRNTFVKYMEHLTEVVEKKFPLHFQRSLVSLLTERQTAVRQLFVCLFLQDTWTRMTKDFSFYWLIRP